MSEGSVDNASTAGSNSLKNLLDAGQVPVKLVTGQGTRQETTGLNFELKPGAIVAQPGSTVVFVCG